MSYLLSVIICTHNEEHSILKALRSLYENSIYNHVEVILVDDDSTNSYTLRLLVLLEKFTRTIIIRSQQNLGLSNSRNLGFKHANSEYIVPLDADDTLPPGTLDLVYKIFKQKSAADFIFGDYFLIQTDPERKHRIDCSSLAAYEWMDEKKLVREWKLLGTSPCKKSLWIKVGGYAQKYSYSIQDVDFWIKAIQLGAKGAYVDQPIYNWYRSLTGMNENFDRLDLTRIMNEHREFYLMKHTLRELNNKIFEGYYPYKQKADLIPFGRKEFFSLNSLNKIRFIYFLLSSLLK